MDQRTGVIWPAHFAHIATILWSFFGTKAGKYQDADNIVIKNLVENNKIATIV